MMSASDSRSFLPQPPPVEGAGSAGSVALLPPAFTEAEYGRRRRHLAEALEAHDLDAILVIDDQLYAGPMAYFTGWAPRVPSAYVVGRARAHVLARRWNHLPSAVEQVVGIEVSFGGHTEGEFAQTVAKGLRTVAGDVRRVGIVGRVVASLMHRVRGSADGTDFIDLHDEYRQWRRFKSAEELRFLEVACRSTDEAVEAARRTIGVGRAEYEVRNAVREAYHHHGVEPVIDFVLSTPMAEPTRCVPAQFATERHIRPGDVVVMEISASYFGYVGQALKTFTVHSGPSPRYAELHDVALDVYGALRTSIRPGATVADVLVLADELIDRSKFTIWDDLVHGYGGGGYLPPVIRTPATGGADTPDDTPFIEGETVVLQPNIVTSDGRAGVQIGGLLRLDADGSQELHSHGTDIAVCGPA